MNVTFCRARCRRRSHRAPCRRLFQPFRRRRNGVHGLPRRLWRCVRPPTADFATLAPADVLRTRETGSRRVVATTAVVARTCRRTHPPPRSAHRLQPTQLICARRSAVHVSPAKLRALKLAKEHLRPTHAAALHRVAAVSICPPRPRLRCRLWHHPVCQAFQWHRRCCHLLRHQPFRATLPQLQRNSRRSALIFLWT